MIGIDIIDIALTKQSTDWTRSGFLDKICTQAEIDLVSKSKDPFGLVWRLWSIKESAYKIHYRGTTIRKLNPSKIACTIINERDANVSIEGKKYQSRTTMTDAYICTHSFDLAEANIQTKVITLADTIHTSQSQTCYAALKTHIANSNNWTESEIEITKDNIGAPQLSYQSTLQNVHVSTAHHGCFGAFAFSDGRDLLYRERAY